MADGTIVQFHSPRKSARRMLSFCMCSFDTCVELLNIFRNVGHRKLPKICSRHDVNRRPHPYLCMPRLSLNQSYTPATNDDILEKVHPAISTAPRGRWWARQGLNLRPLACEANARTTELRARTSFLSFNSIRESTLNSAFRGDVAEMMAVAETQPAARSRSSPCAASNSASKCEITRSGPSSATGTSV